MANNAQAEEEFTAKLQACMDAKGWDLTLDSSGGIIEMFTDETEMMRATKDSQACTKDITGIDPLSIGTSVTEASARENYQFETDVYNCLVAQGVKMSREMPSEEEYVDTALSGETSSAPWWPYGDQTVLSMSLDEQNKLRQECPERWVFAQ
ncbi:hypothetical protein [Jonesia quinghaiensis]|uniref:hypothetical protein n=1 Tax=Jonesia quinghaiensis TaxID=262806 RepID=UPI0003F8EAC4|nr:hypothetical protein [Jonesia quinghaiensis]